MTFDGGGELDGVFKRDEPTSEGVLQCPSCGLSPFGAAIGGQYPNCGTALDGEDRTEQKSEALRLTATRRSVAGRSPLFRGCVYRPQYGTDRKCRRFARAVHFGVE